MYKKTILKNKTRVVTHTMPGRESLSFGIWAGAGGRYEDDRTKGAAHFLEHILFKGTRKYSCDEIKKLIEGVGGSLNAFTGEEYTCYYVKIPSRHVATAFDVISDMVIAPLIASKDVERERTVILEEIKMYHDLPQHFVLELVDSLMWPGHPLGKNLAGTFESVQGLSAADLRAFHRTHYAPGNIVVAAAGHLQHDAMVRLADKRFKELRSGAASDFLKARNAQPKAQVKFYTKDIEQMHVALGMFGLENDHKDRHALSLLNIIMGANMSSRLFDQVREKRGLAYAISSAAKSLRDTGIFLVRAGVDNKKVVEAVQVIVDELRKVCTRGVTQNEWVRAKEYYLGQILLGLEDTLDHMLWIGEPTVSLNKTFTLKKILQEVKKVSAADIQRVARTIFRTQHMNLAIVGPLKGTQQKQLRAVLGVAG